MLSASGAWALPKCPSTIQTHIGQIVLAPTPLPMATYTLVSGGEFKDDKRNGQGTYTFANGDIYVGEYKDDKRNGQGTSLMPMAPHMLVSGATINATAKAPTPMA
jgi:hypothetical protein